MFEDYIEKTPGICGGKACLKGHRIRVQDIAGMSEVQGKNPDEIADTYGIPLAKVHVALAYYFENLEEIREEVRQGERIVERLKKQNQSRIA